MCFSELPREWDWQYLAHPEEGAQIITAQLIILTDWTKLDQGLTSLSGSQYMKTKVVLDDTSTAFLGYF